VQATSKELTASRRWSLRVDKRKMKLEVAAAFAAAACGVASARGGGARLRSRGDVAGPSGCQLFCQGVATSCGAGIADADKCSAGACIQTYGCSGFEPPG
jgi:hypothetical protein